MNRKTPDIHHRLHSVYKTFCLLCILPVLPFSQAAFAQETIVTLREVLGQGRTALAAGDYTTAFEAFETVQNRFGEEPEVSEKSFQMTVRPLHAYAALLSGEPETAIRLFSAFVEAFPEDRTRLSFVLFNLARAYSQTKQFRKAIESYKHFVSLDPNRAEVAPATLEVARLMFELGDENEAFQTLDTLYTRQPEGLLRNKARLMALQEALKRGRIDRARDYILNSYWSVTQMPELAILAYAALEMGGQLLTRGEYAAAIECYRLVPPYSELLKAQKQRLVEIQGRFEKRRTSVGIYNGGQFWTQFYTRLIARLKAQLEGLEDAENYTNALYMAFGRAYLLGGRPREAWILFESLARDETLAQEQQAEAHYSWILAAIEIGLWEDAFKIAKGFGRRFPDSALAPDALYLLGSAYHGAHQYSDAIKVFSEFLKHHPDHALAARTLLLRGYNHNLLNRPTKAHQDFESFIRKYPDHPLLNQAYLRRALTFFSEQNYEDTLGALRELVPMVQKDPLEPEVAYHIAATLYAMRDYEQALAETERYLKRYPLHNRVNEVRVLMGDIRIGRGEPAIARKIFEEIDPESGRLFTYSVFQIGKILRAVAGAEEVADRRKHFLDAHIKHFQKYLNRKDIPQKERLSEALYWVGWTHSEFKETEQARMIFQQALDLHGNDIHSEEVPMILRAHARIEKRLSSLSRREREAQLKVRIDQAKTKALEQNRLTYFARINLYLQSMVPPDDAAGLIFETIKKVPIEQMDAEVLGRIAAGIVKQYPKVAEDHLVYLEDQYPDSRHRSYGYFARAQLLIKDGNYEEAKGYFARFRKEAPFHPLSIDTALDYAETLTRTKAYAEAQTVLEDLLRMRMAKGRPHAKALLALSKNAESSGNLKQAIPYAQRVYNVYRAYHDLAAEAYWISALQFEALGDRLAAYKSLDEMLSDPKIRQLPLAEKAKAKYIELKSAITEEASEPAKTKSTNRHVERKVAG